MRPQHFLIFAIAIVTCAVSGARAADQTPLIILADAEAAEATQISAQDLTGGVGSQSSDASPMMIQMAQPSSVSSPSNAPSNYSYVRVPVTAGH
jgi:hypothetical protein